MLYRPVKPRFFVRMSRPGPRTRAEDSFASSNPTRFRPTVSPEGCAASERRDGARGSTVESCEKRSVESCERGCAKRADASGSELRVQEIRFAKSLRGRPVIRPLAEALAAAVPDGADGGMPSAVAIEAAMGEHSEAWLELLGRACGRDLELLGRLSDADGAALSMAMWEANGPFLFASRRRRSKAGRRRKGCSARSRPRRARPR